MLNLVIIDFASQTHWGVVDCANELGSSDLVTEPEEDPVFGGGFEGPEEDCEGGGAVVVSVSVTVSVTGDGDTEDPVFDDCEVC